MAKKKINKSEAIRQYMAKHPDAFVTDIAKALKVQPGLVYQVKASLHAKKRRKKTTKRKLALKAAEQSLIRFIAIIPDHPERWH